MTGANDLATVEGIQAYISGTLFDSVDVLRLSGGYGNYTYRLSLRAPFHGHETVILKHAKPYVAAMQSIAFSLQRQVYEVTALRQVREMLPADSLVTVPEVLRFDESASVIIMSDCQRRTGSVSLPLKQALISNALPLAAATQIGLALGEFLARLHAHGRDDRAFAEFFAKNEEGKKLSALVTYGRLVSTLTGNTLPALMDPPFEMNDAELERVAAVAAEMEREMLETRETVVMGDFWPGNVLVSFTDEKLDGDGRPAGVRVDGVYVIDWEMAKTGLAGLDIGQFVAELQLICDFKPEAREAASNVRDAFLRAYGKSAGTGLGVARRALTHIGAHLVAWTVRTSWEGKEKMREVVRKGVDLLVRGHEGAESYIRDSVVGPLLR